MHCSYCGIKSGYDDLMTEAWHCLNCDHVNEAVNGIAAWAEDVEDLSCVGCEALVRHADRMLWW